MSQPKVDKQLIESVCLALSLTFRYSEGDQLHCDEAAVSFDQYGIEIYYWEEQKFPWTVSKATVIPGVRYRRDGTGEPDDVDITDISSHEQFQDALIEAIAACGREAVIQQIDALGWESLYSDDESYQDYKAAEKEPHASRLRLQALGCKFETDAGMVRKKEVTVE